MSAASWFPAACAPAPSGSPSGAPRFEPVIAAATGAARFYRAAADGTQPESIAAIEAAAAAGLLAGGALLALPCGEVPGEGAVARAARRAIVAGLAPSQLALELPMAGRSSNDDLVLAIAACRGLGVSVVLDGFAAGGGDFALLLRARPDFLRLDGDFIDGIAASESRAAMVQAIVRMAASLDVGVIAGGVGDAASLNALCRLGVGNLHGPRVRDPQPAACFASAAPAATAPRPRDRQPVRDPRDAGAAAPRRSAANPPRRAAGYGQAPLGVLLPA